MHIKINTTPYLSDANLAQILNISGEVLADGIEITEEMIPVNFESKNDVVYNVSENKIQYKTDIQKQEELVIKIQNEILNRCKPLLDAMTFQEISISKGSDPANAIFTDQEIKDWGNYIANVANGGIKQTPPELPEKYKTIIG